MLYVLFVKLFRFFVVTFAASICLASSNPSTQTGPSPSQPAQATPSQAHNPESVPS
jgi:hypothetical protein